jgi:phosphatidylglycerophosphate synthase
VSMRAVVVDPANLVTLSRIPLSILVWVFPHQTAWVLSIIAIGAFTDWLDGHIARRHRAGWAARNNVSDEDVAAAAQAGTWMDPLFDKTFVLSCLGAIFYAQRPEAWLLVAIGARELLQGVLWAGWRFVPNAQPLRNFDFRAAMVGKTATVLQFATVYLLMANHPLTEVFALTTCGVGIAAALYYLRRAMQELVVDPKEPS